MERMSAARPSCVLRSPSCTYRCDAVRWAMSWTFLPIWAAVLGAGVRALTEGAGLGAERREL